jgi:ribosomal-protein-alanine N-acetyltransferase
VPSGDATRLAFRLRPMTAADLAGVVALERELFPEDPWSPAMFADEVAQPPETRLYLIAEAEAEPEGDGAEAEAAADGARGDGTKDDGAKEDRTKDDRARGDRAPVMAGYAGVMFAAGGTQADVLTIAVRPSCWGSGIGSALLAALVAAAVEHDCTELFLEVRADNPRARGLYLRRGFAEIGLRRRYYQPSGVDAIVMRKDLSA